MIVISLAQSASGGHGEMHVLEQRVSVAADGRFALAVDAATFVPETYRVVSPDAPSAVVARFVVTGGAGTLPGLPNTGGGGAHLRALPAPAPAVVGGLLAVRGVGLLAAGSRRRVATQAPPGPRPGALPVPWPGRVRHPLSRLARWAVGQRPGARRIRGQREPGHDRGPRPGAAHRSQRP